MLTIKNFIFCDIQLSLKYIHTGQTEMLCSHLGNAYSILLTNVYLYNRRLLELQKSYLIQ